MRYILPAPRSGRPTYSFVPMNQEVAFPAAHSSDCAAGILGLGVPGGMAFHRQTLGQSLLLGVPQENACHRPLFLCESENRANKVLVNPGARAGIAAQASRARGDQQVLNRAPAGREVFLVNNFVLIA